MCITAARNIKPNSSQHGQHGDFVTALLTIAYDCRAPMPPAEIGSRVAVDRAAETLTVVAMAAGLATGGLLVHISEFP